MANELLAYRLRRYSLGEGFAYGYLTSQGRGVAAADRVDRADTDPDTQELIPPPLYLAMGELETSVQKPNQALSQGPYPLVSRPSGNTAVVPIAQQGQTRQWSWRSTTSGAGGGIPPP